MLYSIIGTYHEKGDDTVDILFEIIADIFGELLFETASNKKISPWIRYPALILACLLCISLFALIGYVGIRALFSHEALRIVLGLFLVAFDIFFAVYFIVKVKKDIKKDIEKKRR